MGKWDGWLGRKEVRQDQLDEALAQRWLATFDLSVPSDGVMPHGIHFCLCTPDAPTQTLGEDGHPARSDTSASFMPPVPLPRRMWASSAITFLAPLTIGSRIERVSRIASIAEKEGSSGKLAFVEVDHVTTCDEVEAVREKQILVYRGAAPSDAPLVPPSPGIANFEAGEWDAVETILPDPRLLFRFSALTFNTHRIHYDAPYAQEIERYRGLVVHGPLMASLLLQLLARTYGEERLADFSFRAVSPAIAGEPLHLALRRRESGIELSALATDGRECVKARASLA
ncbi:MaoC family dehydratase N-terminal domain-containing protein [Qipengyuania sp. XHP0207]|uniref:FAS1-like dehydratase domain-containing protein n=1 Tax=Qipengyuania sp. XHP0207 TaxID=3038078 RepID=UPI00241D5265|nr:MaoC family dehydratase N-terminal domain-containing protein [Qipengyuania sp. XHP0207]MDG5747896.1 MaoC family dehydratase N-terminal domain-containing protein [Qipengyuania sp. XHP0207]